MLTLQHSWLLYLYLQTYEWDGNSYHQFLKETMEHKYHIYLMHMKEGFLYFFL